ncbi:transcriptional regulator protein [Stutzerimonas stutzeri]|uniref:hypothetical protein n=1 Tax=Stutzerimonas stutzeri subgroup TaxID=578833 RepID=UPI000F70CB08|nr:MULTISPECIES: hypothetical protein [Stutzerimonas stutzeri subgroup]MCQ2047627.1 hypothetical protein [Stutzerimonas kunmingensis]VEI36237.1 transcriptional regulator protein [Stutzerimonas stutzeri]
MKKLFDELLESVQQMDEIHRGQREPSRRLVVEEAAIGSEHTDAGEGVFDTSSTPPKARNEKAL